MVWYGPNGYRSGLAAKKKSDPVGTVEPGRFGRERGVPVNRIIRIKTLCVTVYKFRF